MRTLLVIALLGIVALAFGQNVEDVAEDSVAETGDNTIAVKIPEHYRRPIFRDVKQTLPMRPKLTRDAIKGRGRKVTKDMLEAMKLKNIKNKAVTLDLPVEEETGDNTVAVKIPEHYRRPVFRRVTRDAIKGRGRKISKENVKKILEAMNLKNLKNVKTTQN